MEISNQSLPKMPTTGNLDLYTFVTATLGGTPYYVDMPTLRMLAQLGIADRAQHISTNKFTGSIETGKLWSTVNGLSVDSAGWARSTKFTVVAGQLYAVGGSTSGSFNVLAYDNAGAFISVVTKNAVTGGYLFTTPAGTAQIAFNLASDGTTTFPTLRLNLGGTLLPWEAPGDYYYYTIKAEALSNYYTKSETTALLPQFGYAIGKNTININGALSNGYLTSAGVFTASTNGRVTEYISVVAGQQYTISGIVKAASSTKYYSWYDSSQVLISTAALSTSGTGNITPLTVTAPVGAAFIRVTMCYGGSNNDSDISLAQMEKGAAATAWEAWEQAIITINSKNIRNAAKDIYSKTETYSKAQVDALIPSIVLGNLVIEGVNLFNPSNVMNDKYILNTSFLIGSATDWKASGYIKVTAGTTYTISGFPAATGRNIQFADANQTILSATPGASFSTISYTFTAPAGCEYVNFTIKKNTEADPVGQMMMNVGSVALPYVAFVPALTFIKTLNSVPFIASALDDGAKTPTGKVVATTDLLQDIKNSVVSATGIVYNLTSGGALTITYPDGTITALVTGNKGYSGNNMLELTGATFGGVASANGDDVAPMHIYNSTLGANHGYPHSGATITAHGLTNLDIGTIFVDSTSRQFVVMRIIDANTVAFMAVNIGTAVSPSFPQITAGSITRTSPAATLTVSSVNTGLQLYPSIGNLSYKVLVNGRDQISSGGGNAAFIDVVEQYEIISPDSIVNNIIARAGTPDNPTFAGTPAMRIKNTYRFTPGNAVVIITDMLVLLQMAFDDWMGSQMAIVGANDGNTKYMVPNSSIISGNDFRSPLGLVWSTSIPDTFFTVSSSPDPDNPPNRVIMYRETSTGVGIGCMMAVLKTRGVGKALQDTTARTYEIRKNTGKIYIHLVEGSVVGAATTGTPIDQYKGYNAVIVRAYTDLSKTRNALRWGWFNTTFDGKEYLWVDYRAAGLDLIDLGRPDLNGKPITVIESNNASLRSDTYNKGVHILSAYASPTSCFMVLSIG